MDRRQITFITLNGFCPSPRCSKWTISSCTEYQSKINKKCTPIWHCISCFEGTSYEKLQDTATSCFICCCFISDFTSADITFNTFLELHSVLSEKRSSSQIFLFQQIYPNPPPPERPKSAKCDKSFLSMLLCVPHLVHRYIKDCCLL